MDHVIDIWKKKYGLKEYDVWEILKLSSGRMIRDNIEFIFYKILLT